MRVSVAGAAAATIRSLRSTVALAAAQARLATSETKDSLLKELTWLYKTGTPLFQSQSSLPLT